MLWELEWEEPIDCTPAIGPVGELYLATGQGPGALLRVTDCEDSAHVEWSLEVYNAQDGVAIGEDGTVYMVADKDGRMLHFVLMAVSPDGAVLWEDTSHIELGDNLCPPVIDEQGRLIVGDDWGGVHCFNPDGTMAWQWLHPQGDPYPGSLVLGCEDRTYLHNDEYLDCLDKDGRSLWRNRIPEEATCPYNTPVVATDSVVIVLDPDRAAIVGFGFDGELRWEFWAYDSLYGEPPPKRGRDEGDDEASPIIGPDGNIYLASDWGLYCVSYGRNRLANTAWPTYFHDPAHSGWAGRQ